jgi:hypothetical protein
VRNVFIALAVLSASALLAAACSAGGDEGAPTATAAATAEGTITIGDTVNGVPEGYDPAPFSMMLLSCLETGIAVNGSQNDGYDTFTAKPGMKFVIIEYRLTNNDVRQHDTPLINGGDVRTAPNGYLYFAWSPPLGVQAAEYAPRQATQEELGRLSGDAGAYRTLLPGESVTGRVVFAVPTDARPLEANLAYVPAKIAPDGQCRR